MAFCIEIARNILRSNRVSSPEVMQLSCSRDSRPDGWGRGAGSSELGGRCRWEVGNLDLPLLAMMVAQLQQATPSAFLGNRNKTKT